MEGPNSGMNEEEARAFHGYMVAGTAVWTITTIIAHFLVWSWRPWF